jgi:hypothetical protein
MSSGETTMRIGSNNSTGIGATPWRPAPDRRDAQSSQYLVAGSRPSGRGDQIGAVRTPAVDPDASVLNPFNTSGIISSVDEQLGVIGQHDVYEILYGDGIAVGLRSTADGSGQSALGAQKGDGVGLDEGWTLQLSPPLRTSDTEAIELPRSTTEPDNPGAGSPLIHSITRPEWFGFRIRGMLAKLDSLIAWRRGEAGSMGRGEPREFTSLHRPNEPQRRPLGT